MIWWLLFEIALNLFDVAFLLLILTYQLGRKENIKTRYLIFYYLLTVFLTIAYNHATFNNVSVVYLTVVLLLIYAVLFLEKPLIIKVFWIMFPLTLMYGADMVGIFTVSHLGNNVGFDDFSASNAYRLYAVVISKSVESILLWILLHHKINLEFYSKALQIFFITGVSASFIFLISFEIFGRLEQTVAIALFIKVVLGFSLVNVLYLYILIRQTKTHELILKHQYKDLNLKAYKEIEATQSKFLSYQVAVNELLQEIWGIAKIHKNSTEIMDRYLNRISQINIMFLNVFDTGDKMIDSILSGKESIANNAQIKLKCVLSKLPQIDPLVRLDISIILIHLLDNCIDAIMQSEIDEPFRIIELSIQNDDSNIVIETKNITDIESRTREQIHSLTTADNRGFGLMIIKEIVDKYQGTLDMQHENYYFSTIVTLPLKG